MGLHGAPNTQDIRRVGDSIFQTARGRYMCPGKCDNLELVNCTNYSGLLMRSAPTGTVVERSNKRVSYTLSQAQLRVRKLNINTSYV